MEKFLGVDPAGIAHSERAAATNLDTSDVGSGLLAGWYLGSHGLGAPMQEPPGKPFAVSWQSQSLGQKPPPSSAFSYTSSASLRRSSRLR
jgi:hypothetical protein